MSTLRNLLLLAGLTLVTGCDQITELLGGASDPESILAPARQSLDAGDLPDALVKFREIEQANPNLVEAKVGLSYALLLAGDLDQADRTLEQAMGLDSATDLQKSEINLRRAIIALRKGDLASTQKYGEASTLPAGLVLAAEVYLADAETGAAIPLFERAAASGTGEVRKTAKTYLDYLNDQASGRAQLAEATALWALGQREEACEAAEELLRFLPPTFEARDELLLLWAGRAVAAGRAGVAEGLLDEMAGSPPDQVWRVQATRALVAVANQDFESAESTFANLKAGGAPIDGLTDAIATAAAISKDRAFARKISEGMESDAVARGLHEAGASVAAKNAGASGTFSRFLESN